MVGTRLVLHKCCVGHNSERLTMAFELISTPSGTPLCIVQDLQVWDVCHNAIEIIPR